MTASEIRQRIKKWELLRLPFNAVCLVGSWLAWGVVGDVTIGIDELPAPMLADDGVLPAFAYGFGVLNVAYCLVYAFEFLAGLIPARAARILAIALYAGGCALGFLIAARGSSGIAHSVVSEHRIEAERKAHTEQMKHLQQLEEEARKKQADPRGINDSGATPPRD